MVTANEAYDAWTWIYQLKLHGIQDDQLSEKIQIVEDFFEDVISPIQVVG